MGKILISLDMSGSMGPKQFIPVFDVLMQMSAKIPLLRKARVTYFLWASSALGITHFRGLTKANIKTMMAATGTGGTNFLDPHIELFGKIRRPDITICMTDGEFYSRGKVVPAALKRAFRTWLWVLPPGYRFGKSGIKEIDPRGARRTVEVTVKS
jgi:predicted metal-dependent peptidase